MNNTITANEAKMKILGALRKFEHVQKLGTHNQMFDIRDVAYGDFFLLYRVLHSRYGERVRLYMPGEMETEGHLIIMCPCIGCTIGIESEPCVDFRWRIRNTEWLVNIN
jgi:hypothetical protein